MNWIDIITTVIIPMIGAILVYIIYPYIKSKTTKEERDNIMDWVRIAVMAAEQMQAAGLINMPKKAYVLNFIKSKGFDITEEDLDMFIESAVKELRIMENQEDLYMRSII